MPIFQEKLQTKSFNNRTVAMEENQSDCSWKGERQFHMLIHICVLCFYQASIHLFLWTLSSSFTSVYSLVMWPFAFLHWFELIWFNHSVSQTGMHRRQIVEAMDSNIKSKSSCYIATADNKYIMSCGFWDKSFRVFITDTCMYRRI